MLRFWLILTLSAMLSSVTGAASPPAGAPETSINGVAASANVWVTGSSNQVTVLLQTSLANGQIYYTLDGSEPSSESRSYSGPFVVAPPFAVWAIAYSEDFLQFAEADPIYSLLITNGGGGTYSFQIGQTNVTLTPTALSGWSFMNWRLTEYAADAASGVWGPLGTNLVDTFIPAQTLITNEIFRLPMDGPKKVEVVFGTTIQAGVVGSGAMTLSTPPFASDVRADSVLGPYPYGSVVRLSAVPSTGSVFSRWGGALNGNTVSPADVLLTNAVPAISALFAKLGVAEEALTLLIHGQGTVTKSPSANSYPVGQIVILNAQPPPGSQLVQWEVDGNEPTDESLTVTMDQSKTVTAIFTRPPTVRFKAPPDQATYPIGTPITLKAEAVDSDGTIDRMEFYESTNLLGTVTNTHSSTQRATFTWNNAPAGAHTLRVLTFDNWDVPSSEDRIRVNVTAKPGQELWAFPTTAKALSTAVSIGSDGTIYFGDSDGGVFALYPDGKPRWTNDAASAVTGPVVIAPDGTIYAGTEAGWLYALTPTGAEKWPAVQTGGRISGSALGTDGSIYAGSQDHFLYKVNPADGSIQWKFDAQGPIAGAPAIGTQGTIYISAATSNLLYAVNPDGTLLKSYSRNDANVAGSPFIGKDGTVYVGVEHVGLYAFDPTLSLKWSRPFSSMGDSGSLAPDGTIYIANGAVVALNPSDGSAAANWATGSLDATQSVPAIASDGTVYFSSTTRGYLYARNSDGSEKWTATNGVSGSLTTPTIGWDGTVYVSFGGTLHAIKGAAPPAASAWPMAGKNVKHNGNAAGLAGDILWKVNDLEFRSSPALDSSGTIYGTSAPGHFYSLRPDGSTNWMILIPSSSSSPAITPEGSLYLATDYPSKLIAYNGSNDVWEMDLPGAEQVSYKNSPALGVDGTVYFATYDGLLIATNRQSGTGWQRSLGTSVFGAPVIGTNGLLYIGATSSNTTQVLAIDPDQRTIKYSFPLDSTVSVLSPAVGADGTIYIADDYHRFYALSPSLVLKWKKDLGEYLWSSPVIGPDGTVYLSVAAEQFELHALAPDTGQDRWVRALEPISYNYSSLALGADGVLYAGTGKRLYAVKDVGTNAVVQWLFEAGDDIMSSPVLSPDGILYVGSDVGLYAIKASSHLADSPWPMFRKNPGHTGNAGALVGQLLWNFLPQVLAPNAGNPVQSSPALDENGNIYFGGYYAFCSLRPDGTTNWVALADNGPDSIGVVYSTPVLDDDGTIYFAQDYPSGLKAYSRQGQRLWSANLPNPSITNVLVRMNSPALGSDKTLYLGTLDGNLYATNHLLGTGWVRNLGEKIEGSPSIGAGGTIYIGAITNGSYGLFAINPTNNTLRVKTFAAARGIGSPSVGADGTVYLVVDDAQFGGNLYALRPDLLSEKWPKQPVADPTLVAPVLGTDGTIYVRTYGLAPNTLSLVAIDSSGNSKWTSPPQLPDRNTASSLAVASDGTIYMLGAANLYALKDAGPSASVLWHLGMPNDPSTASSPVLSSAGALYIGSFQNGLFAVRTSAGLASSAWPLFGHDARRTGNSGSLSNIFVPHFSFSTNRYSVAETNKLISVTIQNTGAGLGCVNYQTLPGSAVAITNGLGDFVAIAGSTNVPAGGSVSIPISVQGDPIYRADRSFSFEITPCSGTNTFVATIMISDNSDPETSTLDSRNPNRAWPPPGLGWLRADFNLGQGMGGWRFPWELDWRANGEAFGPLELGDWPVEFMPWLTNQAPAAITANVTDGTTSTNPVAVAGSYTAVPLSDQRFGVLQVNLSSDDINFPQSGAWQLRDLPPPHPNGYTWATNALAGPHVLDFLSVPNYLAPSSRVINVFEGADLTSVAAGVYLTFVPPSVQPNPVTDLNQAPYWYCGQLVTDAGFGSGIVVRPRVVLTAAHLLFRPGTTNPVETVRWFFEREKGIFEPLPLPAGGWYVSSNYVSAIANDPSGLSPQARDSDIAAVWFRADAGKGGYSGYRVAIDSADEWLHTENIARLIGYPILSKLTSGRMLAVGPLDSYNFSAYGPSTSRVFTSINFGGLPGSSGGPLCIENYPVAIYLGESGKGALFRVIDPEVTNLIAHAELSAYTGQNYLGGGIPFVAVQSDQPASGSVLQVILSSKARDASIGWRVRSVDSFRYDPQTTLTLPYGNYTLEITNRSGSAAIPPPRTIRLAPNQETELVIDYRTMELALPAFVNGLLDCTVTGPPSVRIQVEQSADLKVWTPANGLQKVVDSSGRTEFVIKPENPNFIRVRTVP